MGFSPRHNANREAQAKRAQTGQPPPKKMPLKQKRARRKKRKRKK